MLPQIDFAFQPLRSDGGNVETVVIESGKDKLEFFIVERYRLFACRGTKLFSGRVHHSPYQLRKVAVTDADPELFAMDGFKTPAEAPAHALYSERVDVAIYPMELVDAGG